MEPSQDLFDKVMRRLATEEKKWQLKRRVIFFAALTVLSAWGAWPAWQRLNANLAASGFWQFWSLLRSDFNSFGVNNQRSLLWSLLAALPVMSLSLLIGLMVVFLESVKMLGKNLSLIRRQ